MKRRAVQNAAATLAWTILFFLLVQIVFTLVVETTHPELHDPEYQVRLELLNKQRSLNPDRPLLLTFGSSRTVMAFRPEVVAPLTTPEGEQMLPFNFAHWGGNHALSLMNLRRLLRQGIRPRWVLAELNLPFLSDDSPRAAINGTGLCDLALASRYLPRDRLWGVYLRDHLASWYTWRTVILREFAPGWIQPGTKIIRDQIRLGPLGEDDLWMVPAHASAEVIRRGTDFAKKEHWAALQQFHIEPGPDRTICDLVKLCRAEKIKLVLLLMPESREFRSWYRLGAEEMIRSYCADLQQQGAGIVDCRDWLPDEVFLDGHHCWLVGARQFTRLLEEKVLRQLVRGQLDHLAEARFFGERCGVSP
jgi:hypothetical protein